MQALKYFTPKNGMRELLGLKEQDSIVAKGTAYRVKRIEPRGREGALSDVMVYTEGGAVFLSGDVSHYQTTRGSA